MRLYLPKQSGEAKGQDGAARQVLLHYQLGHWEISSTSLRFSTGMLGWVGGWLFCRVYCWDQLQVCRRFTRSLPTMCKEVILSLVLSTASQPAICTLESLCTLLMSSSPLC